MQGRQLYAAILRIQPPWSVERVKLKLTQGEVHVPLTYEDRHLQRTPVAYDPGPMKWSPYGFGLEYVNWAKTGFTIDRIDNRPRSHPQGLSMKNVLPLAA